MSGQPLHTLKALKDEELAARYREQGDRDCLGELFKRYTQLAFLVSMKYLKNEEASKDVVMQVFEKLVADLRKYEVRNFKFWLHRIVKNQCLSVLERGKKQQVKADNWQKDEAEFMENGTKNPLIDGEDISELRLRHLGSALNLLKDEQRQCVELFYLKKKSYLEITEMTGYELKKVKSFIQNGKRNLRIHLEKLAVNE